MGEFSLEDLRGYKCVKDECEESLFCVGQWQRVLPKDGADFKVRLQNSV